MQPDGTAVDFGDPTGEALQNLNNFSADFSKLTGADFHSQGSANQPNGKHNALTIETSLTSPETIADAYLVGIAHIRAPEEAPSHVVFFRQIGTLSPKSKTIRIRKDNMPEGFELLDLDLHIYQEGQEIASDRSKKQFALTRDEVLEYLALERVSTHRGKTLPPAPVWALAPSALLASERPGGFDLPITVHVDAKGRLAKIDESTIVPDALAEIVRELLFVPALHDGVAVPGIAMINLGDFYQ